MFPRNIFHAESTFFTCSKRHFYISVNCKNTLTERNPIKNSSKLKVYINRNQTLFILTK